MVRLLLALTQVLTTPRRSRGRAVVALATVCALAFACKSSAVGVATCRQVEDALCARAPTCGVPLSTPVVPNGVDPVEACQLFYETECLHGLETSEVPSSTEVAQCIAAINTQTVGCDGGALITDPQDVALNGACAWLLPPATATVDAAATTEAAVVDSTATTSPDVESADSGLIIISM
jgi:hypothetical protein